MRYAITLSYDGSGFCGWQIQPDAETVQECLEKALSTLLRCDISVTGAGRTDSGVNAISYVAHFDAENPFDAGQICYKLNAILPHSIVVHSVVPASDDFHARFSATRREYTYFLHRRKDPFVSSFSYLCTFPLDFEAMNRAASLLVGTHDFSCFEKIGADNKTSICTVTEAFWKPYSPSICAHGGILSSPQPDDESIYWYFRISADRFLRNMVRAITGSLIEVGRGKRSIEEFAKLVDGGDRSMAGESVPGNALFLSGVKYNK